MTSKYHRMILKNKEGVSDVYDVLYSFGVSCPATAHAVKKMLMPGMRGAKTRLQDLKEARDSLDRAIEMESFRTAAPATARKPETG